MPLVKLEDFYPNYREEALDVDQIKNFDVYAQNDDKVGSIEYILIDDQDGKFRYFVVDTGFWIFGKKVLLPVGLTTVSYSDRRVYVSNLTKQQVEDLPNFDDLEKVDYDYEEQLRGTYRPIAVGDTVPSIGLQANQDYSYQQEPSLYDLNEHNHQDLKLYEERLIANKHRQKAGEVSVNKRVETATARVAVPIEKERVMIDRSAPTQGTAAVDPGNADFRNQEVARMDVLVNSPIQTTTPAAAA
jgi:stress response protein YsnF